jgi:hypothetical protein
MKKIKFFVLLVLFGLGTISLANGPDVDYSVLLPAISCGQINSLSNLSDGYAILFDYDDATAEKLGRPWKIAEEGKCYSGGYFLLLPPKATKILGDSIVHPENYDTKLNIFTQIHGGIFAECAIEELYPGVCSLTLNDGGYFPGISFEYSSYNILEILNVTVDEAQSIFELFAEQPEVSKSIPGGLNRQITGTEIFKEKYMAPRFASCDKRKREAHIFDIIAPNQDDTSLYYLLTNERIVWTLANGDTREALTGKIIWTKDRINPSDKEILQDFETMGCLNSVFEIRGIVAKMKDPAIDIAKYVGQELEKYNNTKATTTKTVSPQVEKMTQLPEIITSVSKTKVTPDDSVINKEASHEKEETNRSIYFYVLPPIGLLAFLYLLKRKRIHV